MKKRRKDLKRKIFLISILILAFSVIAVSQESNSPSSTPQRMTYTSTESAWPDQVGIGNYAHIVWKDDNHAYYRGNSSNGTSGNWGTQVQLNSWGELPTGNSENPIAIAASGTYVYIVYQWRSDSSDDWDLLFARSSDNGATWLTTADYFTFNTGQSTRPAIAASGSYVYVIWADDNVGNYEIYFKRSTDYGATWGSPSRLTYNSGYSATCAICAAGQYVYLVWQDNNPGNSEIFFKGSGNYGASFGPAFRLTYNSGFSWYPRITCSSSGQTINMVWSDNNPGNYEIFQKRNTTYGTSGGWSSAMRRCYSAGSSYFPDIDSVGSGTIDITWCDSNPGNWEIFGKVSGNFGASFGGVRRWTYNAGQSYRPKVNTSDWLTIWQDDNPGNEEIFIK